MSNNIPKPPRNGSPLVHEPLNLKNTNSKSKEQKYEVPINGPESHQKNKMLGQTEEKEEEKGKEQIKNSIIVTEPTKLNLHSNVYDSRLITYEQIEKRAFGKNSNDLFQKALPEVLPNFVENIINEKTSSLNITEAGVPYPKILGNQSNAEEMKTRTFKVKELEEDVQITFLNEPKLDENIQNYPEFAQLIFKKLDRLDAKMEYRCNETNNRFYETNNRISETNNRISETNNRISETNKRIDAIHQIINTNHEAVVQRFVDFNFSLFTIKTQLEKLEVKQLGLSETIILNQNVIEELKKLIKEAEGTSLMLKKELDSNSQANNVKIYTLSNEMNNQVLTIFRIIEDLGKRVHFKGNLDEELFKYTRKHYLDLQKKLEESNELLSKLNLSKKKSNDEEILYLPHLANPQKKRGKSIGKAQIFNFRPPK